MTNYNLTRPRLAKLKLPPGEHQLMLTIGDNNHVDDIDLYQGLEWLNQRHIVGKVRGYVCSEHKANLAHCRDLSCFEAWNFSLVELVWIELVCLASEVVETRYHDVTVAEFSPGAARTSYKSVCVSQCSMHLC